MFSSGIMLMLQRSMSPSLDRKMHHMKLKVMTLSARIEGMTGTKVTVVTLPSVGPPILTSIDGSIIWRYK